MGAGPVARLMFECAGSGVTTGFVEQSGTMVDLSCGFGITSGFEGIRVGAWGIFVSSGSGKGVMLVSSNSGFWIIFVGMTSVPWERFVVTETETRASLVNSVIGRLEGAWSGAWVWFEGAASGKRIRFESGFGRPAELGIRVKVLPVSGDGIELGL